MQPEENSNKTRLPENQRLHHPASGYQRSRRLVAGYSQLCIRARSATTILTLFEPVGPGSSITHFHSAHRCTRVEKKTSRTRRLCSHSLGFAHADTVTLKLLTSLTHVQTEHLRRIATKTCSKRKNEKIGKKRVSPNNGRDHAVLLTRGIPVGIGMNLSGSCDQKRT
jgi:hypothetical protein